ncbi:hypothetical protein GX48_07237 [Paracoccidioides brasiliensis]|nr:hypothetical protein GX48_07237 [Paracoccidioides brasiliensis]
MPGESTHEFGSPCWFNIPATDINRAKSFYAAIVFGWSFKAHPDDPSAKELVLFKFPDPDLNM